MAKIPLNKIKKTSPKILLKMINRMKAYLKTNQIIIDMFKKHKVSIDELDLVPMKFGDVDVSATTDHAVITFSYKLLTDGDWLKDYSYATHELEHWLDQTTGTKPTQGADDGDYLQNPFEQKGFQRQIEYIDDTYGGKEADKYTEKLLDHHDKDGKTRTKLKEVLMDKVKE